MQVLGASEQIDGIHVGTAGYSSCFGMSLLDMDLLCTSTNVTTMRHTLRALVSLTWVFAVYLWERGIQV